MINGKIYIGMHQTEDLNDCYMGSGKYLKRAQTIHGIENFKKEYLHIFSSFEEMKEKEAELVNEDFLERNDVYNLQSGGGGGFYFINKNRLNGFCNIETAKYGQKRTIETMKQKYTKEERSKIYEKGRQLATKASVEKKCYLIAMEKSLTTESREKRKETFKNIKHAQGNKNSQFGTCWIYHELIGNKKCKKELLPEYIEQGWIKGRFL